MVTREATRNRRCFDKCRAYRQSLSAGQGDVAVQRAEGCETGKQDVSAGRTECMDAEFRPVRFTLKRVDVLQSTSRGAAVTILHYYAVFMALMVIPSVSWMSITQAISVFGMA